MAVLRWLLQIAKGALDAFVSMHTDTSLLLRLLLHSSLLTRALLV